MKFLDTINELLLDRKYEKSSIKVDDNIITAIDNDGKKCIIIYEYDNEKINKQIVMEIIDTYEITENEYLILILNSKSNININLKKEIFIKPLININKHKLVPKHELLTENEINNLSMDINKLPLILKTDPVIKWFNFKIGSIIKITRSTDEIYYRKVK